MKNIWILLIFGLFELAYSEEVVETELVTKETYELSILKVYPDSFPRVSVIFNAENEGGYPLWNLKKGDINVFENDEDCQVISIKNISKEKGINIGVVIDASGSMIFDENISEADQVLVWNHYFKWNKWPKWYKKPIDFAKESILSFLENDYSKNDSILLIPFSSEVLSKHSLSADLKEIKKRVNQINPDGGTAFYDALYYSVEKLSHSTNQSVVVALTDGMDNSSTKSLKQVVELSKKNKIKIFVIGLGMADKQMLKKIASETGGQYFYTKDPKELSEIYLTIKSRIKSIYNLEYLSQNSDFTQETRNVKFKFVNKAFKLNNNSFDYTLPEEVINYLKDKEERRLEIERAKEAELIALEEEQKENEQKILIGGLIVVLLVGGGFYVTKKIKSIPKVSNFYPNPVDDNITIEYKIPDDIENSTLSLRNIRGRIVRDITLVKGEESLSVSLIDLKKGWYFATIITENGNSESVKIYKK